MERPFERVYTVNEFYDRPRTGFADLDGVPHAYNSIWRDDLDDWDPENRYELSPVPQAVLALALEDWTIWRRWEEAYYAGRTSDTSHPALPPDRARHAELAPLVEQALRVDPTRRHVAIGEFRLRGGAHGATGVPTTRAELEVRWTLVQPT